MWRVCAGLSKCPKLQQHITIWCHCATMDGLRAVSSGVDLCARYKPSRPRYALRLRKQAWEKHLHPSVSSNSRAVTCMFAASSLENTFMIETDCAVDGNSHRALRGRLCFGAPPSARLGRGPLIRAWPFPEIIGRRCNDRCGPFNTDNMGRQGCSGAES